MKSRAELESELEAAERRLIPISEKLDQLISKFAVVVVPDVQAWIRKEAVTRLQESHEKVNQEGPDFVRNFKADVTELLNRADSICVQALGDIRQWPHNKEMKESDLYTSSNDDFFSNVFRRSVSSLGTLLFKHSLIADQYSDRSWKKVHPGYEYAYNPGFDGRKYDEVVTYRNLLKEHFQLKQGISRLKVAIEKAKAMDLWDSV
jgi:hypothetical protein